MRRSGIVGITVFSCLLLLTQYISYQRYLIRKEAEQQYVARELNAISNRLEAVVSYSQSAVKTLAFIVAEYGIPRNFDSIARNILQSSRYIDALQLTQKGIITHTYPSFGNEAAIGFDILSDSVRRHEANRAIKKGELFFAGPFELMQGGLGIVGRLPIIKKDEFQGFAVVIIKLNTMLSAIGIDTTQQGEFLYQLSKTNTTTQQEEYFLSQSFDEDHGTYASIEIPAGDWKIMVMANKKQRFFFNITFSIVGLLLSMTSGLFAWYFAQQPEKLKKLVNEKTILVTESQNQFRTTLERVSDGFISYDLEWRYRYINSAAEDLLGLKLNELINKNIWEEFPELINQPIYEAYHKAKENQRYVFFESYLPISKKWFENHLYPSADGLSVFFRDVTIQKNTAEDILRAYKEKESVLQRISDKVISLDTEWRYTFLNEAALQDHPAGSEGALGKIIWDVHPELQGTVFWDKYHEAYNNKTTVAFESFYAPMKKWFSAKCFPSNDGLTVFYQDITDKKEKDKLIEINEARLIEAQSVANVGSWETDFLTLNVIWSLQTYHIFELDPASFKPSHTSFLDFVHPQDRDKVDKAFTESFQYDDDFLIEHRIITQGGKIKWVEERWKVFRNEKRTPYRAAGTCQDITKRKVAEIEKALMIDNTEESFILVDNDLIIISFNNQFYKLHEEYLGFKVEKGKSILAYAQPERQNAVKEIYSNVLGGKTKESEINFPLKDGTAKVFSIKYKPARNETNEIIGVFVTTRDITERKKAEAQIQTEKFFSDSLINSLPGIFYLYDEKGVFSHWNKNFEDISGYSAEEIKNMHPLDFYDEDEKLLIKSSIDTVFSYGHKEITAHFYTKDKRKKPYYFNGHKIVINGTSYLIGVGIDITERIQAEKELLVYTEEIKRLTAHLEQIREDERTRIAREVHDELGQQLTGLKMDASWLSKRIDKEHTSIHEKLSGMTSLMDHTIKTIRRISTDLRPGILDDLGLVAALEWQSTEFEKQYGIVCVFKSEVGDLQTERHLATTVFRIYQEALTNIARHAQATEVESIFQKNATHLILTVKDNGQGFNYKEVKSKGTLGLIGMRERAIMVGAELSIKSKNETGTIVKLQIPLTLLLPSSPGQ
ncbi:PAS domain S-box protein [Chryseotalea sanaruensis]|uniref:PAS domain S-box protein n=1 Tax=Chryseotalea sanaruensis TaxID=2482724 RepID=A0A401U693_9BACT|nr:PAS domain S-box protein [Chryseotalea sanaruensis]GCC50474.1 PAS domain S-box protein [Chryseotalea sanaruensis]